MFPWDTTAKSVGRIILFNGWWGCERESPACAHCYAETFAHRLGKDIWGGDKPRQFFGEKHWNQPAKWNRLAAAAGERHRVFAMSMADILENRRDLDEPRERLFKIIEQTTNLDWLILTKRHNELNTLTPAHWLTQGWPINAWAGVTAENQEWFERRMEKLAEVPAGIRWLSVEPMLGPIKLGHWAKYIHWVIVGGESGAGAREMKEEWHDELLAECREHGIAYHFKQKGKVLARKLGCEDEAGKKIEEWAEKFRVQEFPAPRAA